MRPDPVVICWSAPTDMETRLAALADAARPGACFLTATPGSLASGSFWQDIPREGACGLVTCATLFRILSPGPDLPRSARDFAGRFQFLFVTGFEGTDAESLLLGALTDGAITGTAPIGPGDQRYHVGSVAEVTGVLGGGTFGPVSRSTDRVFTGPAGNPRSVSHVSIEGRPFFAEERNGGCRVFLLACSRVADVDAPLPPGGTLQGSFAFLVPEMLFLRHVFGPECWHAPQVHACLVIDDPRLVERYGFLDFRQLRDSMHRHGFFTTIAFIPWNYRRTRRRMARLFDQWRDTYSLCIHGCDHTEGEFATADAGELQTRSRTAARRMEQHREATGIDFDPVMVFPKGKFSTQALRELKSSGYLAAADSTISPADGPARATMRTLLEMPPLQWEGFPVFLRRYPAEAQDMVLDAFFGRPVLIVEHHTFFKDGLEQAHNLVDELNRRLPGLRWLPLGSVIQGSCQVRTDRNGGAQVKFYARRFLFRNSDARSLHLALRKQEAGPAGVQSVRVDGVPVPFRIFDGQLLLEIDVAGLSECAVQVVYADQPVRCGKIRLSDRARAALRRRLSELRDNHLSRNPLIMRLLERGPQKLWERRVARHDSSLRP